MYSCTGSGKPQGAISMLSARTIFEEIFDNDEAFRQLFVRIQNMLPEQAIGTPR